MINFISSRSIFGSGVHEMCLLTKQRLVNRLEDVCIFGIFLDPRREQVAPKKICGEMGIGPADGRVTGGT